MNHRVLFIDGENFLHKVREILKVGHIDKNRIDLSKIDLDKLLTESLKGFKIK